MRLTKKNYYTLKNKYLTSSKLKDYLIDPAYFYAKHVAGAFTSPTTEAMLIGKGVDCILTDGQEAFIASFKVPEGRRNLRKPPKGHLELTQAQYAQIMTISDAVADTQVYQDIISQKYISQRILKFDNKYGIFDGVAGIPDWYRLSLKKTVGTIIDLKTTSDIDARKFSYKCDDLGYHFQQAFYQMLIGLNYPSVNSYESYALVVETKIPYRVRLYKFNQDKIEGEKMEIIRLIEEIKNTKKFISPQPSWLDCEII